MRRPGLVVRFTAVGVGIVYAVVLHLAGIRLEQGLRQGLAYLPAVTAALLIVWDLWVWRWPVTWRATSRPRLDGLWAVQLHPTKESHIPPGGSRGPIDAYVVVKQSFWTVAVQQFTAESSSISRSFFWDGSHGTGTDWLTFIYDNTPMQRHQHHSKRHLGTCSLRPGNRRPTDIEGMYFTDRYTKGDMKLTFVSRNTDAGSFSEAGRKHAEAAAKQAKG
jgi:hypothetical protein